MTKLATDVYVDGVLYEAGEDAPDGVTNPAAFDLEEWQRDSAGPRKASDIPKAEAPAEEKPADEKAADKSAPAGRK